MEKPSVETLKVSDWFHGDGFPISVEPRNPQQPFGLHNHEFCEIVVVTSGQGLHLTGDERWPIVAGDAFVITGNRPHTYEQMKDLRLLNILYRPDILQLDIQDLAQLPGYFALFRLEPVWRDRHEFKSRLHLTPMDLSYATSLIEKLQQELAEREPGFRFLATSLFMEVITFLSRCYSKSIHTDSQSLLRIAEAIVYIETHYAEPTEVEHLAEISHMSKRSFMRAFKKATGLSTISYLIRVRVSRAVELLRREKLPISKIASLVGYEDSNYFCRQFHSVLGISPSAYRRQFPPELSGSSQLPSYRNDESSPY